MIIIAENQSIATFNNIPASYENSFICGILEQSAAAGISLDMIAQSPATSDKISLGFTFDDCNVQKLLTIAKGHCSAAPLVDCGNARITVKAEEMTTGTGFAAKVFAALKRLDCIPLLVTTGTDEISLLVRESDRDSLERELRVAFGE